MDESLFKEFCKDIKKVSGKRKTTINNSYGIIDGFHYYRSIRPKQSKYVLTENEYRYITRNVNDILGDLLMELGEVKLPLGIGNLSIESYDNKPRIVDGKVKYNTTIDWDKTHRLWFEDEESKNNKTLVKIKPGTVYKFKFKKGKIIYQNRKYFYFNFSRTLKNKLKLKIKNKEVINSFKKY